MKKTATILLIAIAILTHSVTASPFLEWDPPLPDDDVTEHIVYEWKLDGTYVALGQPVLMPSTLFDLGILEKRRYRLVVTAVNVMGPSLYSDAIWLPASIPRKPGKLRIKK
jgi:hypothetical protein